MTATLMKKCGQSIIRNIRLDTKLCAPAFRQVCPYSIILPCCTIIINEKLLNYNIFLRFFYRFLSFHSRLQPTRPTKLVGCGFDDPAFPLSHRLIRHAV